MKDRFYSPEVREEFKKEFVKYLNNPENQPIIKHNAKDDNQFIGVSSRGFIKDKEEIIKNRFWRMFYKFKIFQKIFNNHFKGLKKYHLIKNYDIVSYDIVSELPTHRFSVVG